MIKKLILSMIVLSSLLQADNIFAKLPYGIKIGKKVPDKIVNMNLEKGWKFIKGGDYTYALPGKFKMLLHGNNKVYSIYLGYSEYRKHVYGTPPKRWRKSGLWFCNNSVHGTPYEDILQIIKKNNVYDLEANKVKGTIYFKVDNDKQYKLYFNINDYMTNCKEGGLNYIGIYEIEEDEY